MLFFGNLLRECGVTTRLAKTASNALTDIVTMLLGLTVGASTQATSFATVDTIFIFALGFMAFIIASASGCDIREDFQSIPPQNKSSIPHRQRRSIRCADVGPYLQQPRPRIRPDQLSAHACHGPQRFGRNRFSRRSRCPSGIPRLISASINGAIGYFIHTDGAVDITIPLFRHCRPYSIRVFWKRSTKISGFKNTVTINIGYQTLSYGETY